LEAVPFNVGLAHAAHWLTQFLTLPMKNVLDNETFVLPLTGLQIVIIRELKTSCGRGITFEGERGRLPRRNGIFIVREMGDSYRRSFENRERRQVGRGYQKWVECGSPTHVGCTHILPTFSVGKRLNNGRHDLSSPHLPQPHSSDLCASNTFQLTSTPSTITPFPLGKRPGRPYDRAAVDGDGIQWA